MRSVARLLVLLACAGCESFYFDSPPKARLPEAVDGILPNPDAPVLVLFHEAIDPATLALKIIHFETDAEGRLFDEDPDPTTSLRILFEHGLGGDTGGRGVLDGERRRYVIQPEESTAEGPKKVSLPVGPPLALVVEPGLADDAGNRWQVRQVIKFGYGLNCSGDAPAKIFPSGAYILKIEADKPVQTQIQLFAALEVDAVTGRILGQFTNADRDRSIDCSKYGLACERTQACRTLPTPECVEPSAKMTSVDDYPDFAPNATPPTGFTFTVTGCARDREDGSAAVATEPATMEVESPPVKVVGVRMNMAFSGPEPRGEGTFTADDVLIGGTSSGAAAGSITSLRMPAAPKGLPEPP
jgi:hypothetical protein